MENLSRQLNKQPKEVLERLNFIARLAEELNCPAYAVGGFVRDLVMGLKDFDLDVVVEGDGINFAKELHSRIAGSAFIKHRQFGTATVSFEDKAKVDIASARKEIYEHPASLPRVTFGTIKDDLGRRDFSVNAMALDISRHNFGALVDFFAGTDDIKKKLIRALHGASFIDDPTRILRAIRFEQRFNFRIEPGTLRLIREALDLRMLEKVHNHRLRDELILILKEPQAIKCVKRINALCAFKFIHSAIAVGRKTIASLEKIKSTHLWFEENFSHRRKIELWVLYLAVILEGVELRQQEIILSEFAFRRGEIKIILSFKEAFKKTILHLNAARSASHIYRILEGFSYEMILLVLSKTDNQKVKKKITDFLRHYSCARIFISGHDLKAHGITPGPDFKEILKKLLYAKLDGKFESREEELRYLRDRILKTRNGGKYR
jgi:tRNA nucleotidyltransferase (CCA-adding enzyme)